ncbi:MAG: magnesium transporter [Clostridia bacterium]|nr:magnesium transporter [Clostridia bacterium]
MEEKLNNALEQNDLQELRIEKLLQIINSSLPAQSLREELSDYHANDIAEALSLITKNQRLRLYTVLSDEEISDIFTYLENPADFIDELSNERLAEIITEMPSGDAVDFLEELDEDKQIELIELLDEETAQEVELITAYDDDLIGSLMTNDFVYIKNTFSVKQAMNSIIAQAEECENITTVYVTDENEVYQGAIALKDLFIARADAPLESVIVTSYPSFNANLKINDILERLKEYSEESLPIVDNDNRLIGVLMANTVVEVVEEEMEEDYAKLAGFTTATEEDNGILKNLALRLPWLIILLGLGMLVSSLISTFDHIIALLPLLAFFQPMILGMSGNAGTQALGVTVRNISQNSTDGIKSIWRETAVSFINGILLGAISFVLLGLYITFFKEMPTHKAFAFSACIATALLVSMSVSGFCGSAIPLLFKKIGVDPATASGPLITTASDLISALTYYGIISLIINFFI